MITEDDDTIDGYFLDKELKRLKSEREDLLNYVKNAAQAVIALAGTQCTSEEKLAE